MAKKKTSKVDKTKKTPAKEKAKIDNTAKAVPQRNKVPVEMTWDLNKIFSSDAAWEKALKAYENLLETEESMAGKLGRSGKNLLKACEYYAKLARPLETLYAYAHMMHDSDTAVSKYTAMQQRALSIYTKFGAKIAFFKPELNALDDAKMAKFFETTPELEAYRHLLEETRLSKAHTLSQAEELLLAKGGRVFNASSQSFSILNNADLQYPDIENEKGEKVELTDGRFGRFLESRDRKVRENAFKTVYDTYKQFRNTFASLLGGNVQSQNYLSDVRGYKTAREAALFNNSIPEKVYDNLLKTVQKNLPLLHRYVDLRKRILAVDELHSYDLYTPLTSADVKITYEEAKSITLKALAPLGTDYLAIVEKAFTERWIDVLENKGKRSGAYSGGGYDTVPYILLNWQDTLDNLFTLVHELGHSVHSYLTRQNQPYVYGDYSIFLAEIASTTNENLLTAYLLENEKDPALRLHYINHYLDGFKGTVFRQTQFAQFEQLIHAEDQNGTALTADFLCDAYGKINRDYYGPALSFDEEISFEWARIPHFYYNFYVYQYATGFSAATAFSSSILSGKKGAVDKYLTYLSAGNSDYPLNVLSKAGLDMSKPRPIEAAMQEFERYLLMMEEAVGV